MGIDSIIASLPALAFGQEPPLGEERFRELCAGWTLSPDRGCGAKWRDLETQLRNAAAAARGKPEQARQADGCSLYWKGRVAACFAETDPAKRQDMLDKTWWDAAGELADPASPLGEGALAAYAVRLRIALRRAAASTQKGLELLEKSINQQSGAGSIWQQKAE